MAAREGVSSVSSILRHWKEAVPHDRMAHLVKDSWRGLGRAFQMRLSRHAVPFGHWVFLRILWEKDGITQSELSEQAGLMLPTTHAALAAMERLGYVRRERQAADRRRVFVHLTPKGRAMREPLVRLAEEVNAVALDGLSAEEIATTRRCLLRVIENLARDEAEMVRTARPMPATRDLVRSAEERNGSAAGADPSPS